MFQTTKEFCLKIKKNNPNHNGANQLYELNQQKIEKFYWQDIAFYEVQVDGFLIKTKFDLLREKLTDEQISKFVLTEKDFDNLVKMVRSYKYFKEDKTESILKLINHFPKEKKQDYTNTMKYLSPLLTLDPTKEKKILKQLRIFYSSLKEQTFPLLDDIRNSKFNHYSILMVMSEMMDMFPGDEKVKEYTKGLITFLLPKYNKMNERMKWGSEQTIIKYFKLFKDIEFAKKVGESFCKGEILSTKDFSYSNICQIQNIEFDIEKYPYKDNISCIVCNGPYSHCQAEILEKHKNASQGVLKEIQKDFEKGNYLDALSKSYYQHDDLEFFKYIIKSLIKLERSNEAAFFIKTKYSNFPHLLESEDKILKELLLELPNGKEEFPEVKEEPTPFSLNFKLINEYNTNIAKNVMANAFNVFSKDESKHFVAPFYGKDVFKFDLSFDSTIRAVRENEVLYSNQNSFFYYNLITQEKIEVLKSQCSFIPDTYLITDDFILFKATWTRDCIYSKVKIFKKQDFTEFITFCLFHHNNTTDEDVVFQDRYYFSMESAVFEYEITTGHHIRSYLIENAKLDVISQVYDRLTVDENYIAVRRPLKGVFLWKKNNPNQIYEKKIENLTDVTLYAGHLFLSVSSSIQVMKPLTFEKIFEINGNAHSIIYSKSYLTEMRLVSIDTETTTRLIIIPIENDKRVRKCEFCKKEMKDIKPKICGGCFQFCYCSKDCQVSHWTIHKSICSKLKK